MSDDQGVWISPVATAAAPSALADPAALSARADPPPRGDPQRPSPLGPSAPPPPTGGYATLPTGGDATLPTGGDATVPGFAHTSRPAAGPRNHPPLPPASPEGRETALRVALSNAAPVPPAAPGARPLAPRRHTSRPAAAIDVGTNNCRLLVAVPARQGFLVIDAFSRIVRLGEGVSRHGVLSDAAMERTLEALRICAAKIRNKNVTSVRAVATEACRRAANFPGFRDRVLEATGLDLELIGPEEEARLSFLGCSPLIDRDARHIIAFDIGGGSTEVSFIRRSRRNNLVIQDLISLPMGVVTLAEEFGGDAITPDTFERMTALVADGLSAFCQRNQIAQALDQSRVQMIGASGTVTTLAAINMGLPTYNRRKVDGTTISLAAARAITDRLRGLDRAGRSGFACVGPERADVVVAGCAILEGLLRLWPAATISVADRGVREGILLDLMSRETLVTIDQRLERRAVFGAPKGPPATASPAGIGAAVATTAAAALAAAAPGA